MFNALSILKSIHTRQGGRCLPGDSTDEEKGNFLSLLSELHVWCYTHVPHLPNRSHSPWSAIPPAWNRSSGCHCDSWEMPRASIREQQSMSMAWASKTESCRGSRLLCSQLLDMVLDTKFPARKRELLLAISWTAQRPQDSSQSLLRRQWKSQTGTATSMLFRVSLSWNTAHVKKDH